MSAARRDHVRQQQLGQPDRSEQIDVDDPVMHIGMGFERQAALADARIVDENIDLALPVSRFLDLCGQCVIVGRFKRQDQAIGCKVFGHLLQCFRPSARQDDMRTRCGKGFCQCFADSGRCSGNPYDLVLKIHRFVPRSRALHFFHPA